MRTRRIEKTLVLESDSFCLSTNIQQIRPALFSLLILSFTMGVVAYLTCLPNFSCCVLQEKPGKPVDEQLAIYAPLLEMRNSVLV